MEALTEFVSITQANEDVAKQFLRAFDDDVQAAVEAFFEDPDKYAGGASRAVDSDFSDDDPPMQDDYVRAPIEPVRKRLVADDMPMGRGRGGRTQNPSEAFRDLRSEAASVVGGRGNGKKSGNLSDLFRPPLEVIFKGSYEKARSTAANKQRWLLLNLQDPGIFDCQLLNRDTWSDEALKAILKASFIMLQLYTTSEQATEYTQWHTVGALPHIAILDPETGERKWFHNGLISAADIKAQFTKFLEENPIQIEGAGGAAAARKGAAPVKNFDKMTEDEQMAWVIAQSLEGEGDDDNDVQEIVPRPPKRSASKAGESARRAKAKRGGSAPTRFDSEDEDSDFDSNSSVGDDSDEDFGGGRGGGRDEVIIDSDSDDDIPARKERPGKRKTSSRIVHTIDDSDFDDDLEEERPKPKRVKSNSAKHTAASAVKPAPAPEPVPEPEPEPIEEEDDDPIPEGDPDCTLQLRLPGGKSVVQQFHSVQKLRAIAKFVRTQLSSPRTKFSIATNFPRRVFTPEELKSITLAEAGLKGRAVLMIEEL